MKFNRSVQYFTPCQVTAWGYQMLATLFLAHVLKLNKVIAIVAANISIPPMIPFLLYGSYLTG